MAYVVTENCVKCKFQDCVEVCPVDCYYEGENFLVINPDECIDCGVCEPECPAEAIVPDSDPRAADWIEVARKFAGVWSHSETRWRFRLGTRRPASYPPGP
jgi:ferredoxin